MKGHALLGHHINTRNCNLRLDERVVQVEGSLFVCGRYSDSMYTVNVQYTSTGVWHVLSHNSFDTECLCHMNACDCSGLCGRTRVRAEYSKSLVCSADRAQTVE